MKTVLVTGGGGGIGRVACVKFAARGYRVVACDLDGAQASITAAAVQRQGGEAQAVAADTGDSVQVQKLIKDIAARYGRLDAAFNNAGQSSSRSALTEVREEDWDRVLRTNLSGTFLCMKYEILHMLEQGGGCIVNNCSVFGLGGSIGAAYTASKHGIAGLTKSAAIGYAAKGVRINAVCPGLIDAGMGARYVERAGDEAAATLALHPAGRPGTADEVADAAVWLCSDEARYIHGHLLPVDGGYGAR